jgi:hypothetical protein
MKSQVKIEHDEKLQLGISNLVLDDALTRLKKKKS